MWRLHWQGWRVLKYLGPLFPLSEPFAQPVEHTDGLVYTYPVGLYYAQKFRLDDGLGYGSGERSFRRYLSTALPSMACFIGRGPNPLTRDDWDTYRIQAMRKVIAYRWPAGSPQAQKLLDYPARLINWQVGDVDLFWGRDLLTGAGQNAYGRLLQEHVKRLRDAESPLKRRLRDVIRSM